ncbi:hypothetical protein BT69DRAFT_393625 [Atractiella rhizophila]|nr:hypothetical protein BT69DRAFT_393625 [Atractiella rhizophila]
MEVPKTAPTEQSDGEEEVIADGEGSEFSDGGDEEDREATTDIAVGGDPFLRDEVEEVGRDNEFVQQKGSVEEVDAIGNVPDATASTAPHDLDSSDESDAEDTEARSISQDDAQHLAPVLAEDSDEEGAEESRGNGEMNVKTGSDGGELLERGDEFEEKVGGKVTEATAPPPDVAEAAQSNIVEELGSLLNSEKTWKREAATGDGVPSPVTTTPETAEPELQPTSSPPDSEDDSEDDQADATILLEISSRTQAPVAQSLSTPPAVDPPPQSSSTQSQPLTESEDSDDVESVAKDAESVAEDASASTPDPQPFHHVASEEEGSSISSSDADDDSDSSDEEEANDEILPPAAQEDVPETPRPHPAGPSLPSTSASTSAVGGTAPSIAITRPSTDVRTPHSDSEEDDGNSTGDGDSEDESSAEDEPVHESNDALPGASHRNWDIKEVSSAASVTSETDESETSGNRDLEKVDDVRDVETFRGQRSTASTSQEQSQSQKNVPARGQENNDVASTLSSKAPSFARSTISGEKKS